MQAGRKNLGAMLEASAIHWATRLIGLEFHSKMIPMGQEVIEGNQHKPLVWPTKNLTKGLVIRVWRLEISRCLEPICMLVHVCWGFRSMMKSNIDDCFNSQNTMMRARFSSVPVVVAPHNMASWRRLRAVTPIQTTFRPIGIVFFFFGGLVEVGVGIDTSGLGGGTTGNEPLDLQIANTWLETLKLISFRSTSLISLLAK